LLNGSRFEIVKGKYYTKSIECPYCQGVINKPEEKRTDVNVAVKMVSDATLNKTDTFVLVSADSDLVPPLEFIKKHFPEKKIKIYFPPSNFSSDLNNFPKRDKGKAVKLENNKAKFLNSVMSDTISDSSKVYTIPDKWKV